MWRMGWCAVYRGTQRLPDEAQPVQKATPKLSPTTHFRLVRVNNEALPLFRH
jgi:hypothetical protein